MLRVNHNAQSILECSLCSHEGFTSQVRSCVFTAYYCFLENKFLIFDEQRFVHGKWTDFYEPLYHEPVEKLMLDKFNNQRESFSLVPKYSFLQNYNYNVRTLEYPYVLPQNRIFENYQILMRDMLRYNQQTFQKIEEKKNKLSLPQNYDAFHIRKGDRDYGKCPNNNAYLEHLLNLNPQSRNIFLMTDDYGVFEELQKICNSRGIVIYTLCPFESRGHFAAKFNQRPDKYDLITTLLTEIEIAAQSQHFIGYGYSCVSWMVAEKHQNINNCYLLRQSNPGIWGPDVIVNNIPKVYILNHYFDRYLT